MDDLKSWAVYKNARTAWHWLKLALEQGPAYLKGRRPSRFLFFGSSPGDDLLCTAVLRELHKRDRTRYGIMSRHLDLFERNDDVAEVVPYQPSLFLFAKSVDRSVRLVTYSFYDEEDARSGPTQHIIAEMCSSLGIAGQVDLRPYLELSSEEGQFGRFSERQIAIQSSCMGAVSAMRNKEWYPERVQQIVDSLKHKFTFVQLGLASDPPLKGALDLRGKTTIRQSAAVLRNSLCFVGLVGFLMHLARAVDTRSVIVFGGRENPSQSGYVCNVNLYSEIECSPCWLRDRCEYERRCMDMITPEEVCLGIERVLALPPTLQTETVDVVSRGFIS